MSGALEGTKLTMGNIKKNHLVSEIASPRKRLSPKMMTGIKGATPNNPIKLDQSIMSEIDAALKDVITTDPAKTISPKPRA